MTRDLRLLKLSMPARGAARDASSSGSRGGNSSAWVVHDACEFLRKRKLDVPEALAAAAALAAPVVPAAAGSGGGAAEDSAEAAAERLQWVMKQLGGLKERQRRAVGRFVEQAARRRNAPAPQVVAHSESDDEGDVSDHTPPPVRGGRWPEDVVYSNNYRWGDDVPPALAALYRPAGPARRRPARPSPRCFGARIRDPAHPAHNQNGAENAFFETILY
jgi:hypothetical protein